MNGTSESSRTMSYMPIGYERVPTTTGGNGHSSSNQSNRISSIHRRPAASGRSTGFEGSEEPRKDYPIIVYCHLCWDWVWQRPQQFISRLSQRHPILFVELVGPDPQLAAPWARFHTPEGMPNITILRLQFPTWQWQDGALVDAERRRLVTEFITTGPLAGKFDQPVQWFYDPMAVTAFAGRMGEVLTVYDCMDELSQFKGAPPELLEREAELLARADVVFTGGRKLYESKSRFHNNCHFYGCGVDGEHFGKARSPETPLPQDVAGLPRPIFGYFGVVDERLDYELIGRLAEANGAGSAGVWEGPLVSKWSLRVASA